MTTAAWPTMPPVEMIAFAYDGWSILRVGATPVVPLTYEATHPELGHDNVVIAHSLGEVRDLIDMYRAAWDADDAQSAALEAWTAELERACPATWTSGGPDPYAIGCDLDHDHDGAHKVTDPFGPDTGSWTWPVGPFRGITRMDA